MGTPRDSVLVGVIVGAHGIKGEVKLKSFTSDPLSIGRYGPLQSTSGQNFEITKLKAAKDDFIANLMSVGDRNEAEALKGTELFVAREKLQADAAAKVAAVAAAAAEAPVVEAPQA